MFLLRRAAARSLSSQLSTRSIVTKAPIGLRQAQKWQMPVFQKRFASDAASPVQEKTSDETVTTEPTESEKAQQQEAAEAQDVKEESVATPDVADAAQSQSTISQVAQNISEKAQEAAEAMRNTPVAEALMGESARNQPTGNHNEPTPSTILYVGNLFFEVKAQDMEAEFSKYGNIVNCRVAEDARGLSRGFGFVEYSSVEEAKKASEALNGQVLAGRNMAVQFHVRREPRSQTQSTQANTPSKTLFVGNMSFQMSDKDLNDVFRPIRNVLDVRVAVDRRSGQPRGFCHADFVDVASAEAAKKVLESKEIYGRRLRVDYSRSNPREDRREGGREGGREYAPREGRREYTPREPREGGREYTPREGRREYTPREPREGGREYTPREGRREYTPREPREGGREYTPREGRREYTPREGRREGGRDGGDRY